MAVFKMSKGSMYLFVVLLNFNVFSSTQAVVTDKTSYFAFGRTGVCLRRPVDSLRTSGMLAFPMTLVWKGIHKCVSSTIHCEHGIQKEDPKKQLTNVSVPLTRACGAVVYYLKAKCIISQVMWTWYFHIAKAWAIKFKFTQFEIPYHQGCMSDQVKVFVDDDQELSGNPRCGYRRPESMYGLGSSMQIVLFLMTISHTKPVYIAGVYEWLPKDNILKHGFPFALVTKPGYLSTVSGPTLQTTTGTAVYKWKIMANVVQILHVKQEEQEELVSHLSVFDGPDEDMPKLRSTDNRLVTTGPFGMVVLTDSRLRVRVLIAYITEDLPASMRPNPCFLEHIA